MKKMIFSAVALVAFSFAGMANNENGEKKVVEKKVVENKIIIKRNVLECVLLAQQVYGEVNEYLGHEEAMANAATYYINCVVNL